MLALSSMLRHARCYAPAPVTGLLHDIVMAPRLGVVVDIDTLERSALAKVDRVMLLALDALARSGVQIVLVAHREQARAALLQRSVTRSWLAGADDACALLPNCRWIAISDNAMLLAALRGEDRGIALGRPELTSPNVTSIGDTSVRATLWWLHEQRQLMEPVDRSDDRDEK